MNEAAIKVEGVSKRYQIGARQVAKYETLRDTITSFVRRPLDALRSKKSGDNELWALRNISCEIGAGETVGIIGGNGAGKSTFLKILSRITEPTSGHALLHGRVGSLLEVGTGFHPELSGRENIFLNGAILGMRRAETARALDEIVAFAEIDRMLDTAVKQYSSGMYMRLAFAVAAHLNPEIMLVDEVLAVGDVAFQRKCLGKMDSVARTGRTVLFVSHNMQAIRQLCRRAILLKDGIIVADGPSGQIVDDYLRDGTQAGGLEEIETAIAAAPRDPAFKMSSVTFSQDGMPSLDVLSGMPLEIAIAYDALMETPGLHVTIEFFDNEGALLFQSIHNGDFDGLPIVKKGHHISRATIPADFLAPRSYEVRISAGIANVRAVMPSVSTKIFVQASGRVNRAYPGYPTPGKLAPLIPWNTESKPSDS